MSIPFQSLKQSEQIDFFVKCQEIMAKYHPNSTFVIRENNLKEALDKFHDNIRQYKGYVYSNEFICVLWNQIKILDPKDVNMNLKNNAYKTPNPDFNAVSIDFAAFRRIQDCIDFIKENDQPRIEHVMFIRDGRPKIYNKEALLKGLKV